MKTKMSLLAVAVVLFMASCGSSKKSQNDQMMQMMMMMMMQQQNQNQYQGQYQAQQAPTHQFLDPLAMQSNVSQTERLAREGRPQGLIRGYGTGSSANQSFASQRAELAAQREAAASLEVLIQSYLEDYNQELGMDASATGAEKAEGIRKQVVNQAMSDCYILFSDYNKENNRYNYEVCVQIDKDKLSQAVIDACARNQIKIDSEHFEQKSRAILAEDDLRKAGYNSNVANFENQQQQQQMDLQQQQHNMNMQQQQMNMQQQQLNMQQQQQQHNNNMQQQRMDMRQQQQQHNNNIEQQYMNQRFY